MTLEDFHRMGADAAYDRRPCVPPELLDSEDPRRWAYLDGYNDATDDLIRKSEQ